MRSCITSSWGGRCENNKRCKGLEDAEKEKTPHFGVRQNVKKIPAACLVIIGKESNKDVKTAMVLIKSVAAETAVSVLIFPIRIG